MISRVFFGVAGAPPDALFFVFALAHFGCGVAASGVRAALNGCLDGLAAYPRNWGASSYITSDMPREATQEFGGWKTPEGMGEIYSNVQTEELAEVRAVLTQFSICSGVEGFLNNLEPFVTLPETGGVPERWVLRA